MGIKYRGGYKYQLTEGYACDTGILPTRNIATEFVGFGVYGEISIRAGYAWDGASGPAIDTPSFMRASLVHDALYQLMREGHLDEAMYRLPADRLLRRMCIEDGMSRIRAWWIYWGVRIGGGYAARPGGR